MQQPVFILAYVLTPCYCTKFLILGVEGLTTPGLCELAGEPYAALFPGDEAAAQACMSQVSSLLYAQGMRLCGELNLNIMADVGISERRRAIRSPGH